MVIEHYSFGRIIINGKTYTTDIIIFPDRINPYWWRKEGHLLHLDDIEEVIKEKPDLLIIGTGYNGVMKVPEELIKTLLAQGMDVVIKKTPEAVEFYNERDRSRKTVICLHLTC
ncbi:MAG: Mth938-like domain-containing protein [Thermodesulfovibrionales bacterium]|nr:Mth938-like domain-containing protein [Thermodesulfovibrionales bacterium]